MPNDHVVGRPLLQLPLLPSPPPPPPTTMTTTSS
jgi:hypothetical protein